MSSISLRCMKPRSSNVTKLIEKDWDLYLSHHTTMALVYVLHSQHRYGILVVVQLLKLTNSQVHIFLSYTSMHEWKIHPTKILSWRIKLLIAHDHCLFTLKGKIGKINIGFGKWRMHYILYFYNWHTCW